MSDKDTPIHYGQLATDLSFVTRALRACLRSETDAFYTAHHVPSGGIAILSLIGLNQGLSQKDLAAAIVIKKSAMTKIVNELVADGLIERRKSDGDQRLNALYLTAKGDAAFRALTGEMQERQDSFLSPLSPAERALLFEMLWRVIDGFEARGGVRKAESS